MNMEELYVQMKEIINFFGLEWSEKDMIQVEFGITKISFLYKNLRVDIVEGGKTEKDNADECMAK